MRRLSIIALLSAVLLTSGCSIKNNYIDKRGTLDDSLYYYEQDTGGEKFSMSGEYPGEILTEATTNYEIKQVPHPGLVDMDSKIHIKVDQGKFTPSADGGLLSKRSDAIKKLKEDISEALLSLEKVIHTRGEAIKAYPDADLETFLKLKKKFGEADAAFIDQLLKLWPETDPDNPEMVDAYFSDDTSFMDLQKFLQVRIDALEAEDRKIANEVYNRAISLSIEAFLKSPQKDPLAVHLDGYDTLKQGKLQLHDRMGLDLTTDELKRLKDQIESTQKMAIAAESVRKGETSLRDAFFETLPLISPRLNKLAPKIKLLEKKFEPSALEERIDKTEELFNSFLTELSAKADGLSASTINDLNKIPKKFETLLRTESTPFVKTLSLFSEIKELQKRWSNVTAADQQQLILDSLETFNTALEFVESFHKIDVTNIEELVNNFVMTEFDNIETTLRESISSIETGPEAIKLREHLEEILSDVRLFTQTTEEIVAALGITSVNTVAIGTRAPETLQVPLGDIKDTFIDLKYTSRLPGDTISVRATLYKDKNTVHDTSNASFQVERFGWYAELSPAVVLVKPDNLAGGSDGFRFAPILSWMHHYVPRQFNNEWHSEFLKGIQPAVGIHSSFLNFNSGQYNGRDADKDLGLAFSIWQDRLQFGTGYNLMAESPMMKGATATL